MFKSVTKLAVRTYVALVVSRRTQELIIENTDIDPDSTMLKLGSWCSGEVAAQYAAPYTDEAVDKTFAWFAEKRNKRQTVTSK